MNIITKIGLITFAIINGFGNTFNNVFLVIWGSPIVFFIVRKIIKEVREYYEINLRILTEKEEDSLNENK